MGILPSLKVTVEKPGFEVADSVKNLMKRPQRQKPGEPPKFWSHKERLIVGTILGITILGSIYFYYQGQGKFPEIRIEKPSFNIGGFGINQTITVE